MIEFFRSLTDKDVHTFRDIEVVQQEKQSFRMTKVINLFGEKEKQFGITAGVITRFQFMVLGHASVNVDTYIAQVQEYEC